MAIKHGVYVYESDTTVQVPITADSAVQCVVGVAPVWMVDDPASVTNVPVLANSAEEAMSALGYLPDFANYGLCETMYLTQSVLPVGPVVYINVLDVSLTANQDSVSQADLELVAGESLTISQVGIIKGTVALTKGQDELVLGTDYVISYDSAGKLVIDALTSQTGVTLTAKKAKLSAITATTVVGAYDSSTGASTGIEAISTVYPKLGVIPTILAAPGFGHLPAVGIALAAKAANINGSFKGFAFVDVDTSTARVYTAAKTVKESSGFNSEFAAAVWPCVRVGDYIFDGSAYMAALTAYTTAENDDVPNRSPSNKILGASGTCLKDGTEVLLSQDQGNIVNSYGICTFINLNGWRSWGSYTSIYPNSGDVKDIWIPTRQIFNWVANTFILTYLSRVDDPLNQVLVETVVDSENMRLSAYVPGVMAGAEIEYVEEDNPVTDIMAGIVRFREKIAPYTPAQAIEDTLTYDVSALSDFMAGINGGGE